jgi:alpha-beta hydrolase superfamily lysophospholipase
MLPHRFQSFDGTSIHWWSALPSSVKPSAKVLLVHGLGTHSDSLHFRNLRKYLNDRGLAVYGFDLRGYGKSGGRRAFVNHWRDFREDMRLFVEVVRRDEADLPLFVLGVSMGGLIAVNYALHYPEGLRGLIALAPALDTSGVPSWRRWLLRGLSKLTPKKALRTGLDVTRLTRDLKAGREFLSDPLWQPKVTVRLASEIAAGIDETLPRLPVLKMPLLVLHGSADVVVPPVAGECLYRLAGSADKKHHVYEGAYHVLTMEINREQVFDDISLWIAERSNVRKVGNSL